MNSLHYSPTASASNPLHTHLNNPPTPSPSPSSASIPLKRTRAKRSCDFCRKRKSRCDADSSVPCSNCRAWGYTCEFQTVRKKRGPPSVYVDNLEKRCKKMEQLLVSLTSASIKELEKHDFKYDILPDGAIASGANTSAVLDAASPPAPSDSSSDDDEDDDDDDDFDPTADLQQRLTHLDLKDYDSIKYTGHSAGLQVVDHDVFKQQPYIRWPGRDNVVLQMMGQDDLMIVQTGKPDARLDVGLSMRSTVFDSDDHRSHPSASPTANKMPSKQLSDKMIGLYFSHLHPFLPIINKTRFLEQYRVSRAPQTLVQAALALAFRFAGQHFKDKHANDFGDFYFRKVMKRLRDSLRSRLCHVQAALLMTLYLDMDDGDVESVQWFTLGTAIRMAQDLGLHRSCTHWKLPASEIETRHRVFYACYVLDRWMGARAGKPLTILDRDFDTAMPSMYEVTDHVVAAAGTADASGGGGGGADNGKNSAPEPVYSHFVLLIKLSEILGRVLKALYAPKAKRSNSNAGLDDPTILVVFDRRLKNWKASLDEQEEHGVIPPTQKGHLLVFYYTIMLLVHRPFVQLSATEFPDLQSIVADSRRACTDAATNISDILRHHSSVPTREHSFLSLCLPTCFVYGMFQASLVHLSNALQDRASTHAVQTLEQSLALLKLHQHLCPVPRVIEILHMLITINNLPCDSSSSSSLPAPAAAAAAAAGGLAQPSSPFPQSALLRTLHHHQHHHSSPPIHSTAATTTTTAIPTATATIDATTTRQHNDEEYPKSNHLFERMINCSVVGGITPDIRSDVESAIAQQPTSCFLPQPETSQLSINYHYQHSTSFRNGTAPPGVHDYSYPLSLATPHAPLPPPPPPQPQQHAAALHHQQHPQPYVMASHHPSTLAFNMPPTTPHHHHHHHHHHQTAADTVPSQHHPSSFITSSSTPTTTAAASNPATGWQDWNVYIEHQHPVIDNTPDLHIPRQS
ncbi:fungal-specific transcription factor domain-containing protein [Zychaea mexicana]|uniref:fungal-specific transcription factor domain-containing protein n=1 Tax=Zychaea mexicana TaxID=64656 RepID=UPI0022FDC1FF|nr:fungal-specific transcription factor domain-containing protein [Zychaea mexicana]KAI9493352.1 fungal-specific transcription factor domain-containing protein [Zychaea mexicana]